MASRKVVQQGTRGLRVPVGEARSEPAFWCRVEEYSGTAGPDRGSSISPPLRPTDPRARAAQHSPCDALWGVQHQLKADGSSEGVTGIAERGRFTRVGVDCSEYVFDEPVGAVQGRIDEQIRGTEI